jgi:hypothetical protein
LTKTKEGQSCRLKVEKESGLPVTNLEDSLKKYVAMIVLNPFAVIKNNGEGFTQAMDELKLTINHERVHAYHVLCPDFDKSEKNKWIKLSQAEKEKFSSKYQGYNWNDLVTAGREYSAFTLETSPEAINGLVKKCKLK